MRAVVGGLVPEAEDGTSYGVPAFIYAGRPLLGFRAAKKHLSSDSAGTLLISFTSFVVVGAKR